MTAATVTPSIEATRATALQIAVAALEQANALEGVRPLQAGAFRAIAATARGLIAQADLQLAELAGETKWGD